jgi:uncharacterized protein YfdQ (DUF2303 family)
MPNIEDLSASFVGDAVAAGAALAEPKSFGLKDGPASMPFVVVPKGYDVKTLDKLYPAPYRKQGDVTLNDPESFIRMVNDQKGADTKLYGFIGEQPNFLAVFNDHGDGPGWRDHKAAYACPLSVEWQTWIGANKKTMNQQTFAEFIESNEPDIKPPASDREPTMLEVSRDMEARKGAEISQGTRLTNGQVEFTYNESISGTVSKGKFAVPELFTISIPVFVGGALIDIPVRFRYRIGQGNLTMFYDMVRPHKVIEVATMATLAAIEAGTGLKVFQGR